MPAEGIEGLLALVGSTITACVDAVRAPAVWLVRQWVGAPTQETRWLELAVRGANDGLFVLDPATSTFTCSPRFVDLLGWAEHADEFPRTGTGLERLVHPDDASRVFPAVRRSVATGVPFDAEYRVRRRDGTYRWFHGRGTRVVDVDGKVLFAGCLTDVSDHKRAMQLMEQSSAVAHVGGWELAAPLATF